MLALCKKAGVSAVPTGKAHGTVTVRLNAHTYEVTTLRRDVETDGRHAVVDFRASWQEDAARRDFTINALYVNAEAQLFDCEGGVHDLENGVVRFIGDPDARLQEDVLRFLRFFRFHARYAKGVFDAPSLAACLAHKSRLPTLSKERVLAECRRLLAGPNVLPCLQLWREEGIWALLGQASPTGKGCEVSLDRLKGRMHKELTPPSWLVVLKAVFGRSKPVFLQSRQDQRHWLALDIAVEAVEDDLVDEGALLRSLRLTALSFPDLVVSDWLWLAVARAYHDACITEKEAALLLQKLIPRSDLIQPMPCAADDLLALGFRRDARLGKALKTLARWWIEENYRVTREELLQKAAKLL